MAIQFRQNIGRARTAQSAKRTGRALRTLSLAVLLLASVAGLKAQTPCAAKSSSKVATDRLHYLPSETVQVTGTGFSHSCRVALQVNSPEGRPTGEVSLMTDKAGKLAHSFVLPELGGDYTVFVTQPASASQAGGALLASVKFTNRATLKSDKRDYHPGETVTMTGHRWLPGEIVTLVVWEDTGVPDRTFSSTVDAAGDFVNRDLLITFLDIGARFVVRATGQTSGFTARTTFMDSAPGDCFRTFVSGNWSAIGTWESAPTPGCTVWSAATLTPTSTASTITILNGHTVQVTAPVTVDEVTVNAGGNVQINGGVTLTLDRGVGTKDLAISGTVGVSGTLTQVVSTIGSFVKVLTGGVLTVNSGGLMNGGGGSTGSAPTLTVDSGGTWTIASGGALTSAGTGRTQITVNGTATLDGAVSMGSNLTVAGTVTASANISLQSISSLQISGTVTMTAGTLTVTRGNAGTMGSINSGGSLVLQGSSVFALSGTATSTLTVASGGTLTMGPSALVNNASLLAVASGANLKVGSVDGIATGTTNGNVRTTGTDTYNAGANYTYDGTAAQVTGNALPASIAGLTINNATGVTLSLAGNTTVTTALSLLSGRLNAGANKVILPAAATVSATSGWVYATGAGGLQENVALGSNVLRTFPIGSATASAPVSLTFASVTTAGNVVARATAGDHANIGTSTLNASKSVGLSWTITQGAAAVVFTSYSGVFNFSNPADLDAGTNTSYLRVGKYNSPNWTYPTVGTQASTSTETTGITATFGDFQLAEPTPTQLAFVQQPTNTAAGSSITPAVTVQIVDILGNPTSSTASVVVAIQTNPGGGTLSGTATQAAVGGVAAFNNLSIDKVGSGYTLRATSTGLTLVDSSSFNITPGALDHFVVTTPGTQTAGTAFAITTITAQDANNNTVTGYTGTVDLSETGGGAGGTVTPSPSSAFTAGVLSGQSVTLSKSGSGVTITVTGATRTGVSGAFTVDPGVATKIRVETAADGTGSVVSAQNVASGSSVTAYAVSRDANDNFVSNATADSWALTGITGGVVAGNLVAAGDLKSATFTGQFAGTAAIRAVKAGLTSTDSGTLTVVGGVATKILVETALDGSGTVVAAQNVVSGNSLTVYAVKRDANNNFVSAAAPDWSLTAITGGVIAGDLVAGGDGVFTEFPIPTSGSSPYAIRVGPDGNLWFVEFFGNKVGRITPAGVMTEFTIPTAGSLPSAIAAGSDGALWFAEYGGNNIGRITTAGVITEFAIPTAGSNPSAIAAGPDGNLWFAEIGANKIGRITTAGVFTEFTISTANSQPYGIAAGSDGNLWFTESNTNQIGRITTAGVITEFTIPTASSGPQGIAAGPDGSLWFAENGGNKIGKVTTAGAFTEFTIPTASSGATRITAGPDGDLWFTENLTNKIGRITTAGAITEFTIPTAGSQPTSITAGPDGNVWFAEFNGNQIGKVTTAQSATFTGNLAGTAMVHAAKAGLTSTDSGTLTVVAGPAHHYLVTAPASATAGAAFTATVTAQDLLNNTVTGYTGTAHFTSSDGGASLPGDYVFVTGDNGSHTFTTGVTLNTAGSQTVTATDTVTSSITGLATVSVTGGGSTSDLSVGNTAGSPRAYTCSTITYTIVVTNGGPNAVNGATVTDNFPADLTGVTWTCTASGGSSCGAGSGSGNIATTVNLANGGTATLTATGTVAQTNNGTMSNTASVAVPGGVTDPVGGNNSGAVATELNWWVNNATGSDSNIGTFSAPFATIAHAASAIGNSANVLVQVGNSQSGSPYAANIILSGAMNGTASCKTLFQGIASAGLLPLVRGADPAADAGFDVGANHVRIDGFQIENTLVAIYAEAGTSGVIFSNNFVRVADLAYGLLLESSTSGLVKDNRVEAAGTNSFFGIWDYAGTNNTVDGNRVSGHANAGIRSDSSTGLVVQRNIVTGNVIGVHMAAASGPAALSNNTVNANSYLGIYAESPGGAVTSRNNIITSNGIGWGWNGTGTISSNYDDVFGNTANYTYHGTVATGGNSISVNPAFVQTIDSSLPTYYQLSAGSPCINAGTNVGLAYSGSAPDIGAVEEP